MRAQHDFSVSVLPLCIAITVEIVCSLFERASCTWHDDTIKVLTIKVFMTPCKKEMSTCKILTFYTERNKRLITSWRNGYLIFNFYFSTTALRLKYRWCFTSISCWRIFLPITIPNFCILWNAALYLAFSKLSGYLLKPNERTDVLNRCEAVNVIFNKTISLEKVVIITIKFN